jgi:hypothetical protein
MELLMKTKFNYLVVLLILMFFSCGANENRGGISQRQAVQAESLRTISAFGSLQGEVDLDALLQTLDEIAELERAGSWFQGLALTESGLRENAGDFAGAVAAAYKELSWAYGMGLIQKAEIEQGLYNVLAATGEDTVVAAVNAMLAFLRGQWDTAAAGLIPLFNELDEPDGFGRWMILVCGLELFAQEKNKTGSADAAAERRTVAAYRSIRARYAHFPEYWYRGARAFSGVIAAEFAENCINLAPGGPFADECRSIIAIHSGLRIEEGSSIKTMREIDAIISQAINSANPLFLDSLLPLISLPDNPYTVYAVGALRVLAGAPGFRDYFYQQASSARGRLAERLSFISRG